MSMYNDVAESLSKQGLLGSTRSGLSSAAGSAASSVFGNSVLSKAGATIAKSAAVNAAMSQVNKYIPLAQQQALRVGSGVVGDLMQGNVSDAGLRVLDSGFLNDALPGMSNVAAQTRYWNTPTPLFGGITPTEAQRIYSEMRSQKLAKKNLWLIEVSSNIDDGRWNEITKFNMFCTEVEFRNTVSGEKRRAGGAVVDVVTGKEPVDLQMTTLDDQTGTLKRWFDAHAGVVSAPDGTLGLPAQYAIAINVTHAFIVAGKGYVEKGLFRPSERSVSLSRREDGLEELQMTFSQLDTFMRP